MRQLIIRADDIGYSEAVNYGIAKSVKEGLIRSAGLMPNMPAAKHGLDLLAGCDVVIGQHTNVCIGKPCADPSLIPSMLDENGEFLSSRKHREAFKQGKDLIKLDEAAIEVETQYIRFKELTGKEPAYFEAHAIASANLMKALAIVADKYHLAFNDMNPMVDSGLFRGKPIHSLPMDSMNLEYEPFESLKDAVLHHFSEEMPNVFVCHPGYLDDYILHHSSLTVNRTKEVEMLINPAVKEWLSQQKIELVNYSQVNL